MLPSFINHEIRIPIKQSGFNGKYLRVCCVAQIRMIEPIFRRSVHLQQVQPFCFGDAIVEKKVK